MKQCILTCLLLCWVLVVLGCSKEKSDAKVDPPPPVKTEQTKSKEGGTETKTYVDE